jgi:hypothetical protein
MIHRIATILLLTVAVTACSGTPAATSNSSVAGSVTPGSGASLKPSSTPTTTTAPSSAPAIGPGVFTPVTLTLTVSAQNVTIARIGTVKAASQADGYIVNLGMDDQGQVADGAYGATLTMSQLNKAPNAPDFTAANALHKGLGFTVRSGTNTATYATDGGDAINVLPNNGKLDVTFAGNATLVTGDANQFKSPLQVKLTAIGLPGAK